jgi:predicted RNA-binding Zn ribbon-like protein
MRIDRSFRWLGRFPLAVDLADTVRVVASQEVELLVDEDSLSSWVAAEMPRFPAAKGALAHLSEVRVLRDAVRGLLLAQTVGGPLDKHHLALINEASARCPSFPRLTEGRQWDTVELNDDPLDVFSAAVARSTMEALKGDATPLAVCRAPSCGMLFVPANQRQVWCSAGCGNRARVARHAARASHTARNG